MVVIATANKQCPEKRTAIFHWALCLGAWHEKVRKCPNFANQMNRNGYPEGKIALIPYREIVWSQLTDFSWIISLAYICGQFDVIEFSQTLCNCWRTKDRWLEEYQPKWVILFFISALKHVQLETKRGPGSVLQGRMPPPESVSLLPVSSGAFFAILAWAPGNSWYVTSSQLELVGLQTEGLNSLLERGTLPVQK